MTKLQTKSVKVWKENRWVTVKVPVKVWKENRWVKNPL